MNNNTEKNNKVYLYGEIVSEAKLSYEAYGERFYEIFVKVKRLSGQTDILPVTVSERIMTPEMKVGGTICAIGQFRSYNKLDGKKLHVTLTVFVRKLLETPLDKYPNSIVLSGYICKPPIYRITPYSREIADLLIAVNRSYNKSDYIQAIAWGKNARFARNLSVGDRVAISGRIQSREYQKKQSDESFITMTAYEVSISKIAKIDDDSQFDIDKEFDLYSSSKSGETNN